MRTIATTIPYQQQTTVTLHDPAGHGHLPRHHAASVARPRYDPRVPDTFDTGPGPSRAAFFLAYSGVVLAGLVGAAIGYGWADIGCHGNCETSLAVATIVGAIVGATGTGVIAVLILRAMAEWRRPH